MDGVAAIETLSRFHLRHGTTTILPTTITAPWPEVMDALRAVADVCDRGVQMAPHSWRASGRAFCQPHKLGAQPPFNIEPTADRVAEAIATGCVRVVTIAPELEHSATAMQTFAHAGIRVSLGHTTTDHAGAERAICLVCAAGGTVGATHLFNAMSPIEGVVPVRSQP